ncbi:50S ribosomal protein L18 [Candidatus Woesearchaeota archaeon]|nr:50S ribosomal protein L18 [Candidatus Woesearchaeota archaeon]
MAKNKNYNVKFKRRLEQKTNYAKRLTLVKSGQIRLVIRPNLHNTIVQFTEFYENGDKVLLTISSKKLQGLGWKANRGNIPTAYLAGLYAGILAKKKNIKSAILDLGNYRSIKGSRIYAALKGVLDSGINVPHSKDILPSEEAISGKIISNYASILQKNQNLYNKQFGKYLKNNFKPEQLPSHFQEIKQKILNEVK